MTSSSPVFVITGPSGAGKGTLIKALAERLPELEVAVSGHVVEVLQSELLVDNRSADINNTAP